GKTPPREGPDNRHGHPRPGSGPDGRQGAGAQGWAAGKGGMSVWKFHHRFARASSQGHAYNDIRVLVKGEIMAIRRYDKEEFARLGDAMYQTHVATRLGTDDEGKFVAV